MWKFSSRLMVKVLCLALFQLIRILILQLIWCSKRSLNFCTPQRPATSALLATNSILWTDILPNIFLQCLLSSLNMRLCSLTVFLSVITYETSTKGGDEIDEEVPVPLDSSTDDYKNYEATHDANKLTAPKPVDAPSSEAKATVEEPTRPGNPMGDDKEKTDAQNPGDGDDSESSENVDYPLKKTKGKRLLETLLNTPQQKKAKIETPTTGNKTDPYPAKQARKTSDYVHVATHHPVKRATKAPKRKDKSSKQSTPHICGSCDRSFSSPMGLKEHSKAKHGAP